MVEIPFRRIFNARAGRDADWQLLEVKKEGLARGDGAVAVQSHALVGDAAVVDVIELHLWRSIGVAGGRCCERMVDGGAKRCHDKM